MLGESSSLQLQPYLQHGSRPKACPYHIRNGLCVPKNWLVCRPENVFEPTNLCCFDISKLSLSSCLSTGRCICKCQQRVQVLNNAHHPKKITPPFPGQNKTINSSMLPPPTIPTPKNLLSTRTGPGNIAIVKSSAWTSAGSVPREMHVFQI